jgi:hypothetical protein
MSAKDGRDRGAHGVIARLPRRSDRRTAVCLVAWWLGSVTTFSGFAAYYLLPVDIQFRWLSWAGVQMVGRLIAFWLVSGLVMGGWKAVLVATGRASVRTGSDKAVIVIFTLWTLAWPVMTTWAAVNLGVI